MRSFHKCHLPLREVLLNIKQNTFVKTKEEEEGVDSSSAYFQGSEITDWKDGLVLIQRDLCPFKHEFSKGRPTYTYIHDAGFVSHIWQDMLQCCSPCYIVLLYATMLLFILQCTSPWYKVVLHVTVYFSFSQCTSPCWNVLLQECLQ